MPLSENQLKQLDNAILRLMMDDREYAYTILNADMTQAYVCIEKAKGKTNGEIANVLKITRQSVAERACKCKKCNQ